jgi:hypothetical protein
MQFGFKKKCWLLKGGHHFEIKLLKVYYDHQENIGS